MVNSESMLFPYADCFHSLKETSQALIDSCGFPLTLFSAIRLRAVYCEKISLPMPISPARSPGFFAF